MSRNILYREPNWCSPERIIAAATHFLSFVQLIHTIAVIAIHLHLVHHQFHDPHHSEDEWVEILSVEFVLYICTEYFFRPYANAMRFDARNGVSLVEMSHNSDEIFALIASVGQRSGQTYCQTQTANILLLQRRPMVGFWIIDVSVDMDRRKMGNSLKFISRFRRTNTNENEDVSFCYRGNFIMLERKIHFIVIYFLRPYRTIDMHEFDCNNKIPALATIMNWVMFSLNIAV